MVLVVLSSILLLFVFGWLGACGSVDCLGSGNPSLLQQFMAVAMMSASLVPLLTSVLLLHQALLKRPLSAVATCFIWAVTLFFAASGTFQVSVDPGDAELAGYPLFVFSIFFALAMQMRPMSIHAPQKHGPSHG